MLERMKRDYDEHARAFYDRGIPDLVGYAHLFGLEPPRVDDHRQDDRVFVLPAWREIYVTDDERKMTFEMVEAVGENVQRVYEGLGYEIVEAPKDSWRLGRCRPDRKNADAGGRALHAAPWRRRARRLRPRSRTDRPGF